LPLVELFVADHGGAPILTYATSWQIYLISINASMPSRDPSRPRPDCLIPPKGIGAPVILVRLTATIPYRPAHRLPDKKQEAACVAAMRAFNAPDSMMMLEIDAVGMYDTAAEEMGKTFVTTELGGGGTTPAPWRSPSAACATCWSMPASSR